MFTFSLFAALLIASSFLVEIEGDAPKKKAGTKIATVEVEGDAPKKKLATKIATTAEIEGDAPKKKAGIKIATAEMTAQVKPHTFPYQLVILVAGSPDVACGASLVHPKYALTSAHCTAGMAPSDLEIIGGEHALSKVDGCEQTRKVARIIDHEDYVGESNHFQNDISLIELDEPMEINKWVKVINMSSQGYIAKGNVMVAGWGTVDKGEEKTRDVIQRRTMSVVNGSACAAAYEPLNHPITEMQICAGIIGKDENDPCKGDSGGPLVEHARGKYILIGVVSLGKSCADKTYPGIFTNVAAYRSWIDPKLI